MPYAKFAQVLIADDCSIRSHGYSGCAKPARAYNQEYDHIHGDEIARGGMGGGSGWRHG